MATYYKKWSKADIQEALDTALQRAVALKESCLAAHSDPELSAEGRGKRLSEITQSMGKSINAQLKRTAEMCRDMRLRLMNEAQLDQQRAGNTAHRLKLADAMKILEQRGAEITRQEFFELIRPLVLDISDRTAISAAACAGGLNRWQAGAWLAELCTPILKRSATVAELERLEMLVEGAWEKRTMRDINADVESAFQAAKDALKNWNDEMTEYQ